MGLRVTAPPLCTGQLRLKPEMFCSDSNYCALHELVHSGGKR